MIDFDDIRDIPGVNILDEGDIPAALIEVLKGAGDLGTFAADDLPPGFAELLGSGPGVTVVRLAEPKPAPAQAPLGIRELIGRAEAAARGLFERRAASGDRHGAVPDDALLAALLELAATPPGRASELRAKNRILRENVDSGNCGPIGRAMIEAALAIDAKDWGKGKLGN